MSAVFSLMLFFLFAFLLGACVGSFGYCVVVRTATQQSLWEFSRCPACSVRLSFWDLIPLFSYINKKGQCSACSAPISRKYFYAELLFGLVFVWIAHKVGWQLPLWYWWFFWAFLLIAGWVDWHYKIIPAYLLLGSYLLGLLLVEPNNFLRWLEIGQAVSFAITFFFLLRFFFFAVRKKEALGEGDVALVGILGMIFTIPALIVIFFYSALLGVIVVLLRRVWIKMPLNQAISFGPFLIFMSFLMWYYPTLLGLMQKVPTLFQY